MSDPYRDPLLAELVNAVVEAMERSIGRELEQAARTAAPVCSNCGQHQHPGRYGYPDCLNECRARGLVEKGKP